MASVMIYFALAIALFCFDVAMVVVAVTMAFKRMGARKRSEATKSFPDAVVRIITSGRLHEWQLQMLVQPCINAVAL